MAVNQDYTTEGGVWNQRYHKWEWRDHLVRLHRVDDPAVIGSNGRREWWWRGRRHRADGPAVMWPDGRKEWYLHGDRHRADGPAYIGADGTREWWVHDQRHCVDGPAYIHPDGRQWWYVQGRNITGEVTAWMLNNNITWPFTPEQLVEFQLRWG